MRLPPYTCRPFAPVACMIQTLSRWLLLVPMAAALPPAFANASALRDDTVPASSCQPDPDSCPRWMPSQAHIREVMSDYLCELIDRGALASPSAGPVVIEPSRMACAALHPEAGANFVCGGEIRLVHPDGTQRYHSVSPTLHYDAEGRIALYQGEDAAGNEQWHVPASRSGARQCAGQPVP